MTHHSTLHVHRSVYFLQCRIQNLKNIRTASPHISTGVNDKRLDEGRVSRLLLSRVSLSSHSLPKTLTSALKRTFSTLQEPLAKSIVIPSNSNFWSKYFPKYLFSKARHALFFIESVQLKLNHFQTISRQDKYELFEFLSLCTFANTASLSHEENPLVTIYYT